jgi:Mrp family chromosome partitioning ATPase
MEPQQILQFLRRRGWRILCWGVAVGLIVGAATYYFEKPVYQTSTQVLLQPTSSAQAITQPQTAAVDPVSYGASQVTIVRSLPVAQAASAAIPGHPSPGLLLTEVTAVVDPSANVMTITARSGDAAEAQAAANAFAQAYMQSSYKSALGNLAVAVKSIEPRLDRMQTQIASLDTQILAAAKAKGGGGASVGALTAQRQTVNSQYVALFGVQENLRTQIQLTRPQASLVSTAGLPSKPVSPKPLEAALLGATAGLLIGLGIELLREKFDDQTSSAEEIEQITGRALLAQIPKDAAVGTASPVEVRQGEFTEAVRALRTGLQFLGVEHPVRRIVVSSAGTGDGKTTVAAHLAVAYAEAGFVTVLVSGDLRRPQAESLFGASNTGPGLSSLLATGPLRPRSAPHVNGEGNLVRGSDFDVTVSTNGNGHSNGNGNGHTNGNGNASYMADHPSAAHPSSDERSEKVSEFVRLLAIPTTIENLTLIPAGPVPPNPAELLGSTRMREALDALAVNAEVIIIDTPPALVVTDSVALADASDGTLIVMSADKSTRADLKRLMDIYASAEVPVLGVVLNRAKSRGRNDYYAAYKPLTQTEPLSRRARRKEAKAAG